MSIGYACLAVGVPQTDFKSCIMKNASEDRLLEVISNNLVVLEHIIDYNISNNIKLFRISSDIIPFGSSPVNKLVWWEIFSQHLEQIGRKIKNGNVRVSMHPGQYTVLNSPDEGVVKRAIADLDYHTKMLDSLRVCSESKLVLHIGGIYNDKNSAINRFVNNYKNLDDSIKRRLVIENDDKSYNIRDVLEIGTRLNVPVVFDNLHNKINPFDSDMSDSYWINECKFTWNERDGVQKIHYSQQNPLKKSGSHSNSIKINEFIEFYDSIKRTDIDIMLEVKDKNLSAVKCINSTDSNRRIKLLELEWSKYKYKVLENSHPDYVAIRKLLRNKEEYPAICFYNLIEDALEKESTDGNAINAAQHIWGYFKGTCTDKEKDKFFENIEKFKQREITIKTIKNYLWKMAVKYQEKYLLDSYYFVL